MDFLRWDFISVYMPSTRDVAILPKCSDNLYRHRGLLYALIIFGTPVSTDFDHATLEFIENPDPVAAVSRNLQNKTHIACMFCRSTKVRIQYPQL